MATTPNPEWADTLNTQLLRFYQRYEVAVSDMNAIARHTGAIEDRLKTLEETYDRGIRDTLDLTRSLLSTLPELIATAVAKAVAAELTRTSRETREGT